MLSLYFTSCRRWLSKIDLHASPLPRTFYSNAPMKKNHVDQVKKISCSFHELEQKRKYPRCNFITSIAKLEGKLPLATRTSPKHNYDASLHAENILVDCISTT
jgi:hypothetical protein